MRTEAEIRRALDYMASAARGAKALNDSQAFAIAISIGDILCWTLGEQSPFAAMLADMERDERNHKKHKRN